MKTKYIFLITGLRSIEAYIKISKKKFYLKFALPAPYRLVKKIEKNKFNDKGKISVAFNRAMSNMYRNNIFPTLPGAVVEIHHITANFYMLHPFF